VDRFAVRHGELDVRPSPEGAADGTGVITAPDGATASVLPPWPSLASTLHEDPAGGHVDPLEQLLAAVQRPRNVGLVLVRRGGYAVGVAHGARLVESKVGSRYVQGKTKAGGWSQQRYARRRDAQAQAAFATAADVAARILPAWLRDLEGLVTGGDRAAVSAVLADARLRALADLPQGRFLAVPDPRQRVLEDAVRRSRAVLVDVHDPLRD
jgi:hypothetical protein